MKNRAANPATHILKEYRDKINKVLKSIRDLNLKNEVEYLDELTQIENFNTLFGYDNPSCAKCDCRTKKVSDNSLSFAIRSICLRRTCFYLMKIKDCIEMDDELRDINDLKNLSQLAEHFKVYRRVKKCYNNVQIEQFLLGANDGPFALAPLYETFVDQELFMTLWYLDRNRRGTKANTEQNRIYNSLLKKAEFILDEYIDDNGSLQRSKKYNSEIMDEANIIWGLRILYEERKRNFHLGKRFKGRNGFEKVFGRLLNIGYIEEDIGSWKCPNRNDLIFETTPELNTSERTNLYILFNCLELLLGQIELSISLREKVDKTIQKQVETHIVKKDIPGNIYFLCLKFECLKKYNELLHYKKIDSYLPKEPIRKSNRFFTFCREMYVATIEGITKGHKIL